MTKENIILNSIVLLLLIHCQFAMGKDTCHAFLSGLQAKYPAFSNLTEQESFYIQYSGVRGPRDIGERKACEKQPSMSYYVLVRHDATDYFDLRNQDETGICVIKECTKEMLRKDNILTVSFMRFNRFPINGGTIEVYDPHEPLPKSNMFYLCAVLHITVVIFSICSTIIIYKRQKQRERLQTPDVTPEVSEPQNHYLMEAFDLRAALKALYQTAQEQKQNENLAVFGFLRVFSSWWVVFDHAIVYTARTAMASGPPFTPLGRFLSAGVLGVDCFFFMGGFLAVYALVPKLEKEKLTLKSFFLHMKHRFMRIWPLCMAALLFYIYIVRHMFTGALWRRYEIAEYCNKYWLSKILLVDNLVMENGGACAVWEWYASVDLQSFILVILIVSAYVKSRLSGYLFTVIFIILSLLVADGRGNTGALNIYYVFTPARINEMLIGVLFGMHYYEYAKLKSKINLYWLCERFIIVKYLVLLFGIGIWYYIIVYAPLHPIYPKQWFLYSKCLIVVASAVTFAPMNAQKSFWLKSILNLRIFQILGKLSFGLYLFHIPVILSLSYTRDHSLEHFGNSWMTEIAPKAILGGTIVAVFYWIFLERPLLVIETLSHKKQTPPPVAVNITIADSEEEIQTPSNQVNTDLNDSAIELSEKHPENRTSSSEHTKSLKIDGKSYEPLQEEI